jgi:hypothetical protein
MKAIFWYQNWQGGVFTHILTSEERNFLTKHAAEHGVWVASFAQSLRKPTLNLGLIALCLIKHRTTNKYGRMEVPPSWITNFGTRWSWFVGFMPRLLYTQGNNSRYPLRKKRDTPQPGWTQWWRDKSLLVRGFKPKSPSRYPLSFRVGLSPCGSELIPSIYSEGSKRRKLVYETKENK